MRRIVRILEVPLYLLVIAMYCINNNTTGIGIFLIVLSILRLVINSITDEFYYKNK